MTGDASKFIHISPKNSRHLTYGDKNKGRNLGVGKIGMNSSTSIENVLLVDGLKHSLLSVSQLCDKGYLESFDSHNCDKGYLVSFDGLKNIYMHFHLIIWDPANQKMNK